MDCTISNLKNTELPKIPVSIFKQTVLVSNSFIPLDSSHLTSKTDSFQEANGLLQDSVTLRSTCIPYEDKEALETQSRQLLKKSKSNS